MPGSTGRVPRWVGDFVGAFILAAPLVALGWSVARYGVWRTLTWIAGGVALFVLAVGLVAAVGRWLVRLHHACSYPFPSRTALKRAGEALTSQAPTREAAETWAVQGCALLARHRHSEALEALQRAEDLATLVLETNPSDEAATWTLARVLGNQVSAGRGAWIQPRLVPEPSLAPAELFRRRVVSADAEERCLLVFRALCERHPQNLDYKAGWAVALKAAGQTREADALAWQVLEIDARHSVALQVSGKGRILQSTTAEMADAPPDWSAIASGGSTERGDFEPAETRDEVDCTVFAPPSVSAGEAFLVQVFAHLPRHARSARAAAVGYDEQARERGVVSLATEIARGSKLTFELMLPGLEIEEAAQTLRWRGRADSVQFGVLAPRGFASGTVIGRLLVSQDDVPIGQVRFKLQVTASGGVAAETTTGTAERYRMAFISYASSDRAEVLRRVQMLTAVGIRYFQDILELDPGDRWERQLYRHINESDVMFLFWSTAAKQSEWVTKEWRYGLSTRGDEFIRPVIIEGPPPVAPPAELSHIHFNDRVLYMLPNGD